MQFVGSYPDIIKQEWIDFLLTEQGHLLPNNRECLHPDSCTDEQVITMHKIWGIENRAYWYKFDPADMPFTIPWPVQLTNNIDWWVVKQLPGQCVPLHYDPNDQNKTVRYVLMLQDYIPGHMLLWNNELIKDYKAGDLFKVDDVNSYHGSSNISNEARIIAHLTVWN